MDLFARPPLPPRPSAAAGSAVSMTQPTPSVSSANASSHRKKTAASRANTAAAAAAPAAQSVGGTNAESSEEQTSAAPVSAAAAGSVGASSSSAMPTSAAASTSSAQRSAGAMDFFATTAATPAVAAAGGSGGSSSSGSGGVSSSSLKIRGSAGGSSSTTPAKRGNRAMGTGSGGAGPVAAGAAAGGARTGGLPAKRPRSGFASSGAGADIKEESMQQSGYEMPQAMEYESGGAPYQQNAAYGQWHPPQQQHPMQMMAQQPRVPTYSAPSVAYLEPVDLSGVDPTENASPVPVLDVSDIIANAPKLDSSIPILQDLHHKIVQLSLAIFKAQEMASRSRTDLFAASDELQHIMGQLKDAWHRRFTDLQNRVSQHAHHTQRYGAAAAPAYAPVMPVRSAPTRRAPLTQPAQVINPSAAALGGFKAGGAASGQQA